MNAGQFKYTFQYNDEGIRTAKYSNGTWHYYTLNGTQIVSEAKYTRNSSGAETFNYLLVYLYDENGAPIGLQYRNKTYGTYTFDTYYFEKNLQGDIIAIYTEDGTKIGSYTYDAWGNFTYAYATGATTAQKQIVRTLNPFRYRGYYYDTDTGLYYLQSRYYNPQWGRFLNADGYVNANGDLIGFNMYAYCSNNPVNNVDLTGHMATEAAIAATDWWNPAGWIAVAVLVIEVVAVVTIVCVANESEKTNEEVASNVKEKVEAIPNIPDTKDQSVYLLIGNDDKKVKYIGRSNDPVRRMSEHKRDPLHPERIGYTMVVVATGLSTKEAKVAEQVLISAYTLSYLDNARREIAVGNLPGYWDYMSSIAQIIGSVTEDELMNLIGG